MKIFSSNSSAMDLKVSLHYLGTSSIDFFCGLANLNQGLPMEQQPHQLCQWRRVQQRRRQWRWWRRWLIFPTGDGKNNFNLY